MLVLLFRWLAAQEVGHAWIIAGALLKSTSSRQTWSDGGHTGDLRPA